ncbi:MAG: DUF6370 family protein [Acidobacteria bacterium]|jgi:hypothetical protein|nr:DUF6370 family protein [Acidobacteriota bacterium]
MKRLTLFALAFALVLGLSAVALAGSPNEVTMTGKVACSKCTLKLEGSATCQDVFVVAGKDGAAPAYYYFAKTEALAAFEHGCSGEKPAVVTGVVAEKDGKKWIVATKIVEAKS